MMGAMLLASPEVAISQDESKAISKAVVNVAQYYDLTADPKMLAWANLTFVLAGVYGSKAFAIYGRKKRERHEKEKTRREGADVLSQFYTAPGGPGNTQG